jgi:hypothetical protein
LADLAFVAGSKAQDTVQGTLLADAMWTLANISACGWVDQEKMCGSLPTKPIRLYVGQAEAFDKLERGGE